MARGLCRGVVRSRVEDYLCKMCCSLVFVRVVCEIGLRIC